jgi:putative ABC transport system permease protein
MLAIGAGASQQTLQQIERLGSRNILIRSVKLEKAGQAGVRVRFPIYGLQYEDVGRFEGAFSGMQQVVAMKILEKSARLGSNRMDVRLVGTTSNWFEVVERPLLAGRLFNKEDEQMQRKVCVLTRHTASKLLANQATLGQLIRIESELFEVIGIVDSEEVIAGSISIQAPDQAIDVYVPLSTARASYGDIHVKTSASNRERSLIELHQIILQLSDPALVRSAARSVAHTLERFHHRKDYAIDVPLELLKQKKRTKRTFSIVLGSIAGISLIVGGIGIMNIMLASVTERTQEIGIRRAIGATKAMIVRQFLIEAVLLTMSGGILGILFGVAVPYVIEYFSSMPTQVTMISVVLPFIISILTGLAFGLYPAWKAAQLDPIRALRR